MISAEEIKNIIKNAINKYAHRFGYDYCEDKILRAAYTAEQLMKDAQGAV